jgi:hypothetical protein
MFTNNCLSVPHYCPPSTAQLFFVQSKWYQMNYIIMGLSIASFFATVSFITSFKFLDFDFYQVSPAALSLFPFFFFFFLNEIYAGHNPVF